MSDAAERPGTAANTGPPSVVDLRTRARANGGNRLAWSSQGEELSVNLIAFAAGDGVAEHVNDEVEVLLVGVTGEGIVAIDERQQVLRAGNALLIPRGTRRSTRATTCCFAYLTCHRHRSGLRPTAPPANEQR